MVKRYTALRLHPLNLLRPSQASTFLNLALILIGLENHPARAGTSPDGSCCEGRMERVVVSVAQANLTGPFSHRGPPVFLQHHPKPLRLQRKCEDLSWSCCSLWALIWLRKKKFWWRSDLTALITDRLNNVHTQRYVFNQSLSPRHLHHLTTPSSHYIQSHVEDQPRPGAAASVHFMCPK